MPCHCINCGFKVDCGNTICPRCNSRTGSCEVEIVESTYNNIKM